VVTHTQLIPAEGARAPVGLTNLTENQVQKEQFHEKVCKIITLNDKFGPN
jgi:hypothetical protein